MTLRREWTSDERGFALFPTFLLLILLSTVGAMALLVSTLEIRSSTHYRTGNQAFMSAEAGLMHALSTVGTRGVQNFQTDILNNWGTLWGTSSQKTVPGYAMYSYDVALAANQANPGSQGTITVTGWAPLQAQRRLRVAIQRSGVGGSPGALYLAADLLRRSTFNGNSFLIDGNDNLMNGNSNPPGPIMPGISTRNDTVTGQVTGSLSGGQNDNVKGLGFSANPRTPSVVSTGGPDEADLNRMIGTILGRSGVVNLSGDLHGGDTIGVCNSTTSRPQITRFTGDVTLQNGNASGCGIMIVDGSLTINGNFNYIGWIIVSGSTTFNYADSCKGKTTSEACEETSVSGHSTVTGSLWTGDLNITVGGDAIIEYCQACLDLIDQVGITNANQGGNLARPMAVMQGSYQEL